LPKVKDEEKSERRREISKILEQPEKKLPT
jgi:hypothetical protein